MRPRWLVIALAVTVLAGLPLCAQTGSKPSSLSDKEQNGKKMFQQRCSVCHTPPRPEDKTYGPMLNSDTVAGKEAAARETIMKGTARMPGFQYGLRTEEIDNIIAYLKTVKSTGQVGKPSGNTGAAKEQQD